MLLQPENLQISRPDEGGKLMISWQSESDASGYILERRFNEDFSRPEFGLTWENIRARNKNWTQNHQSSQTWAQFEAEPTSFVIFEGPKSAFAALGLLWKELDALNRTWADYHAAYASWAQYEAEGPIGYTDWLRYVQYGYEKAAYRVRAYDSGGESEPRESELLHITPACLHVPAVLYEGDAAPLLWREMTGATSYTLERRWNEDFDAYQGQTAGYSIYAGPGSPVGALAQGLDWRDIHKQNLSWAAFGLQDLRWAELALLFPEGLTWADQRATYSTWRELRTRDRSWAEAEKLADKMPHVSYTDAVALGMKTAAYRLKGRNERGETTYITTEPVRIIPIFEREDAMNISVLSGEQYRFALDCADIRTFQAGPILGNQRVAMKINYDPAALRLLDFAAQTPAKDVGAGAVANTFVEISAYSNGEIVFTANRADRGDEWTGLIACLRFEALRSGNTSMRLS